VEKNRAREKMSELKMGDGEKNFLNSFNKHTMCNNDETSDLMCNLKPYKMNRKKKKWKIL
jgi:hypothetical protein